MITRYASGNRMSLAVSYGAMFETAGVAADDTREDVQGQLRQVLATIEALMAEAGIGKDRLTRVQIWIADYGHFDQVNEIYDAWLQGYPKPVRACVGADLGEGYLVEVQVFAVHGGPMAKRG
ncbi:RidA family protein [Pseudomonas sp. 30_B]|uniref:RidA family protein n=1 Tax=Pseudomonas sp. 30_B TaxID=2813575 RepID=UPI001FAEFC9B|nr:RidA family protein [Pseudomonas sp. 30_B]